MKGHQSAHESQQSAVKGHQSALKNHQSARESQQSALKGHQSAHESQQSAVKRKIGDSLEKKYLGSEVRYSGSRNEIEKFGTDE